MECLNTGEVLHLMPAGNAGSGQNGAWFKVARGRQQAALADAAGDFIMLAGVTEGARHSAAAGIGVHNSHVGNP